MGATVERKNIVPYPTSDVRLVRSFGTCCVGTLQVVAQIHKNMSELRAPAIKIEPKMFG